MNARRKRRRNVERWKRLNNVLPWDDSIPCCVDCGTPLFEWDYYSASGDGPFCEQCFAFFDNAFDEDDEGETGCVRPPR